MQLMLGHIVIPVKTDARQAEEGGHIPFWLQMKICNKKKVAWGLVSG